jgi:polyphosphate kinase 2
MGKHSDKSSNKKKLSAEDLAVLNSKEGLNTLFRHKHINLARALKEAKYELKLKELQTELIKLQTWVIQNNEKVVILFEGRDVAGKGGAIRRVTQHLNPRHFKIIALDIPTEDEQQQWFLQRYINQLPKPGEIRFFDRSWYNRAMVEPVNGFCTDKEYRIFMSQVNDFERMLIQSGTHLIKFYLSISKKEQARRFAEIQADPLKRWKMTPVDEKAQALWEEYTTYKEAMFERTNTNLSPWVIVDANEKMDARLNVITHILDTIPYNR